MEDIWKTIWEFDPTYHEIYKIVMEELELVFFFREIFDGAIHPEKGRIPYKKIIQCVDLIKTNLE